MAIWAFFTCRSEFIGRVSPTSVLSLVLPEKRCGLFMGFDLLGAQSCLNHLLWAQHELWTCSIYFCLCLMVRHQHKPVLLNGEYYPFFSTIWSRACFKKIRVEIRLPYWSLSLAFASIGISGFISANLSKLNLTCTEQKKTDKKTHI